jgi:nicotinate-nucleotide adenylyltransferase
MRAGRSACASCARSSISSKATDTSANERPAAGQPHALDARPAARSIGILGGTFNPPHLGHLAVARHARAELGLELVLIVPTHTPPHKPHAEDPGPQHRLRMCQLAFDDEPGLSVCAVEIERGGPSYSVDTLQQIHASHPHAELTFIVGADTARTLPSWREPAKLLELAHLAVATRAGSPRTQVLDVLAADSVSFLEMAPIEVSSSMARARAGHGQPISELVGPAVAAYIAKHQLYGADPWGPHAEIAVSR